MKHLSEMPYFIQNKQQSTCRINVQKENGLQDVQPLVSPQRDQGGGYKGVNDLKTYPPDTKHNIAWENS